MRGKTEEIVEQFIVEIANRKTGLVDKRMGPHTLRSAEKIQRGASINLDHKRWLVRVVPYKKALAVLSDVEDKEWVASFMFFKGEGLSDAAADQKAWAQMQEQFPRLRGFDGCEKLSQRERELLAATRRSRKPKGF